MTDGNIVAARTKLGRAVQNLTGPRDGYMNGETRHAPSLYVTLVSEMHAETRGDSHTPAQSTPPLRIDACQLLVDIDGRTKAWCPKPGDTPTRLQILAFQQWRPQDTRQVEDITTTVEAWCDAITNLINPTPRKYISAPCPSCSRSVAYYRDSGGDVVRQEALKWTPNVGFECQACKASWSPEQTLFFARLLGIEVVGVLE